MSHAIIVPARLASAAAAVLAAAVAAASLYWGVHIAGGADTYGYLTEAGLIREGRLVVHEDVIRQSPWPGAGGTWTPIGYREVPRERDAIAPVYAPGYPLLMALLQSIFGFCAAFWVVPICAGATIWLTYTLGRRLFARDDIALWGAVLVATSPTFLFVSFPQLSDVPVTAAWTLVLVLLVAERPLAAGFAGALAVAIRPNLVLLAPGMVAWTLLREFERARSTGRIGGGAIRMAIGFAPAVIGIAWINARLYGSPLESGYGRLEDIFSFRYLWTNVSQFSTWIAETDTPVVALALLFFASPRLYPTPQIRFPRVLLGTFLSVVLLSYLFYVPFDAWWYLRFLLPMWPIVMLLTAGALDVIARRWIGRLHRAAVAGVVLLLACHGAITAATRGVFSLWSNETRYVDVARFISATTDPRAVFISWQHTGSIRLYADRLTLQFVRLDRRWLDRAVAHLQATGRRPYIVLDAWEVTPFKERFSADNRLGALDWNPMAVYENQRVLIYDPAVRDMPGDPFRIPASGSRSWWCPPVAIWPPRGRID